VAREGSSQACLAAVMHPVCDVAGSTLALLWLSQAVLIDVVIRNLYDAQAAARFPEVPPSVRSRMNLLIQLLAVMR
jgi:hypothetical protein